MKMKKVKLESLALPEKGAIISGPFGSNISSKFFVERGVPVIRGNNLCLDYSKFNDSGFVFITQEKADELNCWADKEDLLFTAAGTLGQVGVLKEPLNFTRYVISNKQIRVRLDSTKVNTLYAYYWFSSPWMFKRIAGVNKGSTVPLLTLAEIRDLPIFLPENRSTQDAVVEVLESISNKIALNKKMNQKLEAMAKRLYDYWFVQYDFPDKNGHPYKTTGGSMTYNETLKREIPVGWEIKKLEECINLFDSKRIPLSSQQRASKKGVIPYYGATGIMDYVDDFIYDGEYILLAEDGSVETDDGFVIIQRIWGKTWVNNHAHVIQPKENGQYEFYYQVLSSIVAKKITTGSIQKKISQENMNAYKLLSPPKDLVLRYSLLVHDSWEKQKKIVEENVKLQNLRDKLLPLLMNGQVTVA